MPEELTSFVRSFRPKLPFILGASGLLLMIGGFFLNASRNSKPGMISTNTPTDVETSSLSGQVKQVKMVKVDIEGAVEKPGVIEIPYDSRVVDVLITAGGITPKADRVYLSKNINLAQKLVDGMKIYVPTTDEIKYNSNSVAPRSLGEVGQSTLINLNTASFSELDALPGVGPATAAKIISGRPYQDPSELVSRKIITNSVWLKIKDQVSLY